MGADGAGPVVRRSRRPRPNHGADGHRLRGRPPRRVRHLLHLHAAQCRGGRRNRAPMGHGAGQRGPLRPGMGGLPVLAEHG